MKRLGWKKLKQMCVRRIKDIYESSSMYAGNPLRPAKQLRLFERRTGLGMMHLVPRLLQYSPHFRFIVKAPVARLGPGHVDATRGLTTSFLRRKKLVQTGLQPLNVRSGKVPTKVV
jgi:hypothetical protein